MEKSHKDCDCRNRSFSFRSSRHGPSAANIANSSLKSFLAREAALGRANLVFPILYIDVPGLQKEAFRHDDDVLKIIHDRQYVDWRKLRHRDVTSTEVAEKVELFCENIVKALRQSWVQPLAPQKMAEPPRQAEPIVRVAEPEPQIKSERKDGARIEPPPKPLVQETAAVDDVTGAGSLPHDVAQQPSQGPGLTRISQTFKVHRGAEILESCFARTTCLDRTELPDADGL